MTFTNHRAESSAVKRFVYAARVDESDLDYFLERRSGDEAELRVSLRIRILKAFLSAERPPSIARNEREAQRKLDRRQRHDTNTGREHYILGVGDHIEELAAWVVQNRTLYRLYGTHDLPAEFRGMPESHLEKVLLKVHTALVARELVEWKKRSALWYIECNGQMEWGFQTSLIDEAKILEKEYEQSWRNNRNWHGRPENQGRRRAKQLGIAPATSIGPVS